MALAYPFVVAEMTEESAPPPVVVPVPPPSTGAAAAAVTVGPLTLLPKPFASDIDIKDKGFDTREETLEDEDDVDFDFGKNKGSGGGVDKGGGNDDDDDEGEDDDEKVLLIVVVVVEEPARVDELNDCRELAMGILELNEDGGCKGFVAERFRVGESGRDTDEEGVGD